MLILTKILKNACETRDQNRIYQIPHPVSFCVWCRGCGHIAFLYQPARVLANSRLCTYHLLSLGTNVHRPFTQPFNAYLNMNTILCTLYMRLCVNDTNSIGPFACSYVFFVVFFFFNLLFFRRLRIPFGRISYGAHKNNLFWNISWCSLFFGSSYFFLSLFFTNAWVRHHTFSTQIYGKWAKPLEYFILFCLIIDKRDMQCILKKHVPFHSASAVILISLN